MASTRARWWGLSGKANEGRALPFDAQRSARTTATPMCEPT